MIALLLLVLAMPQPWGPKLGPPQRVCITGISQTGKTTFTEKLVAPAFRRVYASPDTEFQKQHRLVLSVDELERYPALFDLVHLAVVVQLEEYDEEKQGEEVGKLCHLMLERGRDLVLVYDEMGGYRRYAEVPLNRLWSRCSKRGIVPVFLSQVQTDLPLTVRKQASDAYIFAQPHKTELAEVEAVYGEEAAARVRQLGVDAAARARAGVKNPLVSRPVHCVLGQGVVG